jgi:hypothetical protein
MVVITPDLFGQRLHRGRVKMVDRRGNPCASELRHEFRGFFDRFGPVVVRLKSP